VPTPGGSLSKGRWAAPIEGNGVSLGASIRGSLAHAFGVRPSPSLLAAGMLLLSAVRTSHCAQCASCSIPPGPTTPPAEKPTGPPLPPHQRR